MGGRSGCRRRNANCGNATVAPVRVAGQGASRKSFWHNRFRGFGIFSARRPNARRRGARRSGGWEGRENPGKKETAPSFPRGMGGSSETPVTLHGSLCRRQCKCLSRRSLRESSVADSMPCGGVSCRRARSLARGGAGVEEVGTPPVRIRTAPTFPSFQHPLNLCRPLPQRDVVPAPAPDPAFCPAVSQVLLVGSCPEVGRVAAGPVVAGVADTHLRLDLPMCQPVGQPVGPPRLPEAPGLAVAVGIDGASPGPALVVPTPVHLRPELLWA